MMFDPIFDEHLNGHPDAVRTTTTAGITVTVPYDAQRDGAMLNLLTGGRLAPDGQPTPEQAEQHSLTLYTVVAVPVIAPSGRRPHWRSRATWAAQRRLDSFRRRRRRRAGLPATAPHEYRVFIPRLRVEQCEATTLREDVSRYRMRLRSGR